ncbi:hypothetical protein X798_04719 [Onchocerca flexuosa]|uniref:Cyclin-like domain-containing protein n=1 Tax=Onchocerca flexuosa TaxID=387005 RepID=A0A238BU79_9BILA|nr:hypothetical protein X798_04719 [Onchocerca flexuosa]
MMTKNSFMTLAPKSSKNSGEHSQRKTNLNSSTSDIKDVKEEQLTGDDISSKIKLSSFGQRRLFSSINISADKWLLTLDEHSVAKLDNPPSLPDGLDRKTELDLRYLGCEIIQSGAILLRIPQVAAATAQILYQRFYYQRSFVRHHFEYTVMACLLLASKIEEAPRRPRDVINVFHRLEHLHGKRNESKNTKIELGKIPVPLDSDNVHLVMKKFLCILVGLPQQFGMERLDFSRMQRDVKCIHILSFEGCERTNERISILRSTERHIADDAYRRLNRTLVHKNIIVRYVPMLLDRSYVDLKNQVIKAERKLLNALGFVVHVNHPHKLIYAYLHALGATSNHELMQKAWSYMNDGLRTDIFLRYRPETIACACIHLAARTIAEPVPLPHKPFPWFEAFDASDRDVQTISVLLLQVYTRVRAPNWTRLNDTLNKLRIGLSNAFAKAQQAERNEKEKEVQRDREKENDHYNTKQTSSSTSRSRSKSPIEPKKFRSSPIYYHHRAESAERDRPAKRNHHHSRHQRDERRRAREERRAEKDRRHRTRSRDGRRKVVEKNKISNRHEREKDVYLALGKRRRSSESPSPVKLRR